MTNQIPLFPTAPTGERLPREQSCISCLFWTRTLTNKWGRCSIHETWEMEWAGCGGHVGFPEEGI
jgi:hypothetical protein